MKLSYQFLKALRLHAVGYVFGGSFFGFRHGWLLVTAGTERKSEEGEGGEGGVFYLC